jgi:hypothetical protein
MHSSRCPHAFSTAASPAPGTQRWVARLGKGASRVQRAVQRARALAEPQIVPAQEDSALPQLQPSASHMATGTLRALPALQPPNEMFSSAMKPVRKLRPRDNIASTSARYANLVLFTTMSCHNVQIEATQS